MGKMSLICFSSTCGSIIVFLFWPSCGSISTTEELRWVAKNKKILGLCPSAYCATTLSFSLLDMQLISPRNLLVRICSEDYNNVVEKDLLHLHSLRSLSLSLSLSLYYFQINKNIFFRSANFLLKFIISI